MKKIILLMCLLISTWQESIYSYSFSNFFDDVKNTAKDVGKDFEKAGNWVGDQLSDAAIDVQHRSVGPQPNCQLFRNLCRHLWLCF